MAIILPHKFDPRPYQLKTWDAIFKEKKKRGVIFEHRRAGKDKNFLNVANAYANYRVGTVLYLFPFISQAKSVIWHGMDKQGFKFLSHIPSKLISKINNSEMRVHYKNGSILKIGGTDNLDALMGTNPIAVFFSEFPLHNPQAWHYIRPILTENGGIAYFNGTPRGRNHGYDILKTAQENPDEWHSHIHTVEDTTDWSGNRIVSDADVDKERKAGMPEELIRQEFYCSFDEGVLGAYYAKNIAESRAAGRIGKFPVDPRLPVYTFWDLGRDDATAIWFTQAVGHHIRMVHYYELSGHGMGTHIEYVLKWMQKYGIRSHRHWAPFDINVTEYAYGRTRIDIARQAGINFNLAPSGSGMPVMDGITAARYIFGRCHFDEEGCKKGIAALQDYHPEYDEKNHTFKKNPLHNWASHGADAFRYFALSWSANFDQNLRNTLFNNHGILLKSSA